MLRRIVVGSAALLLALGLSTFAAAQQKQAGQPADVQLPPAVRKVVNEQRPKAVIDKLTVEKVAGTALYDIEFKGNQGEIELAEDGRIIDVVSIVQMKDLPRAAADAIQKVTRETGAKIVRLEKAEVHSEIIDDKIVKLAQLKYLYEAELVKNGRTGEVTVATDGTIVEGPKWDEPPK